MALAVAIVVFGGFTADALSRVVDVRYQRQERQDLSFVLAWAQSLERWPTIERLPGVRIAEPFRALPIRLRSRSQTQDATLLGLDPPSRLRRLVGTDYTTMSVPSDGIVMGMWLATHLEVRVGDRVSLEIREGRRRVVSARVVGLVDEPLGTNLYMDLQALDRLIQEPNTFSAVNVLADPQALSPLYAVLKAAPFIRGVDFRKYELTDFRSMGDDTVAFIRRIEIVFAVIIAFGVVYNTARISLAERATELATLRVLGFTRREISALLLGEIGLLATPAVPLGCLIGYGLSAWLAGALSTELFRFPVVLQPATYVFGVVVFVAATAASALMVRRRLDRLDLVAVLKARE
jgi:putative ABC transport system permease protein